MLLNAISKKNPTNMNFNYTEHKHTNWVNIEHFCCLDFSITCICVKNNTCTETREHGHLDTVNISFNNLIPDYQYSLL
jgi:hypothetical protein